MHSADRIIVAQSFFGLEFVDTISSSAWKGGFFFFLILAYGRDGLWASGTDDPRSLNCHADF